MEIKDACYYTRTHEWVCPQGDELLVGITDWAQNELGEVVYVELPMVGDIMEAGDEAGMIDSAKTTSPLMNPVKGTVTRRNENLDAHPELVNQSPYGDGWIYAIKPENPGDHQDLLDPKGYAAFVKEEDAKH
jgi:glycine cleavage system H protein